MGKHVYANGLEIAGKASDHVVICAMPDVCLSPPPPPAGPVPVPYPDTSKSKDLKEGSGEVSIGGQPVCLGSKSHYKSAPLGDEACTQSFGTNIIDHTNAGKTHCQAHSMNVEVEGEPVTRTSDITTSNHSSAQPGGCAVPMAQVGGVAPPGTESDDGKRKICDCCKGPVHSEAQASGKPVSAKEWYKPPHTPRTPPTRRDTKIAGVLGDAQAALELSEQAGCDNLHPDDSDDPCAKHYVMEEPASKPRAEFDAIMSPLTPPSYLLGKYGSEVGARAIANGKRLQAAMGSGASSIAHKTPLAAGGCPIGAGNTSPVSGPDCTYIEKQLGELQGKIKAIHSGTFR